MAHTDKSVSKLVNKQKNIAKRGLGVQYDNVDATRSFYDGDAMTYRDRIQFIDDAGRRRKVNVNFNKVQEIIDSVAGFMAQNRRQAKYVARVNSNQGQQLYSKNMNAIYEYHRENTNADQLETEQDYDMLITGVGAIETDLSYIIGNATTLPGGEIIKSKLDPKRTYWDPNATGKNLLDARFAGYFDEFELGEALDLFQGSVEDDFERVDTTEDEGGYVYNPWGGLYDKIKLLNNVEWTSEEQDLVRVYNHQWFEYETFYRAYNPLYLAETFEDASYYQMRLEMIKADIKNKNYDGLDYGDMFDFDPKAEELVFDEKVKTILVKEFGDLIQPVGFKRKCFYTAVLSGEHVFKWFKSVTQQGFSIKFKTGSYNENNKYWMGMVNPMMEPQKYYNKALTELMFTIAANSKGGVMVEESAVEDISDFESKWAKTDAVIKVADGAISGSKIMQKAQGAVPTGLENIITLSAQGISSAGVDPSFLGQMDNEDQSGILYKRRIRQAISKCGKYFDSITLAQKEDARLMADLIRIWVENNQGQVVRIAGDQGADEFMVISQDMLAPEYDVTIQEAAQTPEDKQQTASVLGMYGDKLMPINPAAGQAFYAESLQLLPLDGDIRNRLVQVLQPQQGPQIDPAYVQQLEQLVQELQSEAAQVELGKKRAETYYTQARADSTIVNNEMIKAKVPLTNAQTVKTLEEAARTAAEAHIAETATPEETTVNV